jgi:hypothetical protein
MLWLKKCSFVNVDDDENDEGGGGNGYSEYYIKRNFIVYHRS